MSLDNLVIAACSVEAESGDQSFTDIVLAYLLGSELEAFYPNGHNSLFPEGVSKARLIKCPEIEPGVATAFAREGMEE